MVRTRARAMMPIALILLIEMACLFIILHVVK
jgi:hypothetical protein